MLRRFSSGMVPLKCKKQAQLVPAFVTTFRRANLSLASCTSAELASVLVQNNIQRIKLYLQTVEKSSHVQRIPKMKSLRSGKPGIMQSNFSLKK